MPATSPATTMTVMRSLVMGNDVTLETVAGMMMMAVVTRMMVVPVA